MFKDTKKDSSIPLTISKEKKRERESAAAVTDVNAWA